MQTARILEQEMQKLDFEEVKTAVEAIGIKGYIDTHASEYVRELLSAYTEANGRAPEYFILATARMVEETIERGIGLPSKGKRRPVVNEEAWAKICIRAYLVHRCAVADPGHEAEWSEMWSLIEQATSLL